MIDTVGSRGTAAIPIGNLFQANTQGRADTEDGFGIIPGRSLQRTAWIIG
jgi:hypothetical protein